MISVREPLASDHDDASHVAVPQFSSNVFYPVRVNKIENSKVFALFGRDRKIRSIQHKGFRESAAFAALAH